MFARHQHLNRFVSGGRLYERDGVWISFTVKTELSEDGTLVEVVTRVASLRFSYDERVEDGLYAARAVQYLRDLLEDPDSA